MAGLQAFRFDDLGHTWRPRHRQADVIGRACRGRTCDQLIKSTPEAKPKKTQNG